MKVKEILPLIDSPYLAIKDFSNWNYHSVECYYRMRYEDDLSELMKHHGEKYVHNIKGEKDTVKLIVLDFEAD